MWGKFENLPYVLYFHPSWWTVTPMHNSSENPFVHEGHEGTRRENLREPSCVLGGYFSSVVAGACAHEQLLTKNIVTYRQTASVFYHKLKKWGNYSARLSRLS